MLEEEIRKSLLAYCVSFRDAIQLTQVPDDPVSRALTGVLFDNLSDMLEAIFSSIRDELPDIIEGLREQFQEEFWDGAGTTTPAGRFPHPTTPPPKRHAINESEEAYRLTSPSFTTPSAGTEPGECTATPGHSNKRPVENENENQQPAPKRVKIKNVSRTGHSDVRVSGALTPILLVSSPGASSHER